MKFKVGDRVRVVGQEPHPTKQIVGREGVILEGLKMRTTGGGRRGRQYLVALDNDYTHRIFFPRELAPLTPPAQDEWADAKVKQVTKPQYIEPVKVKERA